MNWYFLRVSGGHEIETSISLLDDGHSAFCPFVLKPYRNRYRKVKEWRAIPRLSGYILYGVDQVTVPWRELKQKTGRILSVIGTVFGPSLVPQFTVDQLIEESGRREEQVKTLEINDLVEISDGPMMEYFLGQQGLVEDVGSSRARIFFGSMAVSAKLENVNRA